MTVQRIDRIHDRAQVQQVELEKVEYRLNLFNLNSFERVGSVAFPDGSRLDIPSMNDSDRETAAELFASVPPDRRAMLDQASQDLGKAMYAESQKNAPVGSATSSSALSALTAAAQAYTTATSRTSSSRTSGIAAGSQQANQAFMGTMYMGLVGLEGDLATKARDLQTKNKLADEIRTDMTEIRNELSNWPDDGSKRAFSWTEVKADGTVVKHENELLTKKEAEALLKNLEEQLTSIRDMSEMAKFDLQKNLQDYQQAVQTFSGILKDSHDQMMRTIGNLKA